MLIASTLYSGFFTYSLLPKKQPSSILFFICAVFPLFAFPFLPWTANASSSIGMTPDGTTVFVVNPDSGSISAVETQADTKIGEIYIGEDPRILALSPDGQRLYVTSRASATLTIL